MDEIVAQYGELQQKYYDISEMNKLQQLDLEDAKNILEELS
jgi:hypothetical protein